MNDDFEDDAMPDFDATLDSQDDVSCSSDPPGDGENYKKVEEVTYSDEPQKYTLKHAYEKRYDESLYVWETYRPEIDGKLVQLERSGEDCNKLMNREQIIRSLKMALCEFSEFADGSKFWQWLKDLDDLNLIMLYDRLLRDLRVANGNVSVFNPVLSYCTGSHNNCQMLGGMVQAKGA